MQYMKGCIKGSKSANLKVKKKVCKQFIEINFLDRIPKYFRRRTMVMFKKFL